MHKAGYCVKYVSPILPLVSYVVDIDYENDVFELSEDPDHTQILSLEDANKFINSLPQRFQERFVVAEVYKPDENDILRGNESHTVFIDDFEKHTTQ